MTVYDYRDFVWKEWNMNLIKEFDRFNESYQINIFPSFSAQNNEVYH